MNVPVSVYYCVSDFIPCCQCLFRRERVDNDDFELPYEYRTLDEEDSVEMSAVSPVRSPISADLSTQADNILKMLDSSTEMGLSGMNTSMDLSNPGYSPPGAQDLNLEKLEVDVKLENEMAYYLSSLKDIGDKTPVQRELQMPSTP